MYQGCVSVVCVGNYIVYYLHHQFCREEREDQRKQILLISLWFVIDGVVRINASFTYGSCILLFGPKMPVKSMFHMNSDTLDVRLCLFNTKSCVF